MIMYHSKTHPKELATKHLKRLGIHFHLEEIQELLIQKSFGGIYLLGASKVTPIKTGCQQHVLSI